MPHCAMASLCSSSRRSSAHLGGGCVLRRPSRQKGNRAKECPLIDPQHFVSPPVGARGESTAFWASLETGIIARRWCLEF